MNDFDCGFPTRREMLCKCGMGFGALALQSLLSHTAAADNPQSAIANPQLPRVPHFRPRAKRVIHLFMNGGPSHVDTFDPKPLLAKYAGKALPTENLRTERKTGAAFPSPYQFAKHGQ